MNKKYDLKKLGKDINIFLKSKHIINQIADDTPWTNEDSIKNKRKIHTNKLLDDDKFTEKTHHQDAFKNPLLKDRDDMEFRSDRKLTTKNVALLRSLNKVNTHLKNIITNKEQHCQMCKVMNKSQVRFDDDCKFKQDTETVIVNNISHSINLVPQ